MLVHIYASAHCGLQLVETIRWNRPAVQGVNFDQAGLHIRDDQQARHNVKLYGRWLLAEHRLRCTRGRSSDVDLALPEVGNIVDPLQCCAAHAIVILPNVIPQRPVILYIYPRAA